MSDKPTYEELLKRIKELESTKVEGQLAFQKSEVRYREMFDNMRNCVAIYQTIDEGNNFIFKDFNKAAEEAEGVRREELIGKNVLEVFPGVKEFGLFDVFQKVWHTGIPSHHPISFYKDERLIGWRENFVYKLPSGEIVAIYEDATLRKQAEQTLKESEEKYRDLLENLPQKIFHKDRNSIYVSCNENYAKDLNIEPDKIKGTTDYDYYPKELAEKYIEDDKRVVESGKNEDIVEKYFVDGQDFWVQTVKIPLKDDNGQVTGVLGIFRDITDFKRMEDKKEALEVKLRHAHKMEAIGTMAGGIAHDFNNILAAILGYADMAMYDIPDYSPAKHQIAEVLKAGNRAKELVKHILSFSRKESLVRVPVAVHLILKESLKFLRATIPTTIEIREEVDKDCGNILADATQIHQVIINLCTNASQAMEEDGGALSVSLSCLELSENDLMNEPRMNAGVYVMLQVKDSGPGIDPKNIDRIFDPYFTTKEVGKGSGMGLAVVIGIVKNHNGIITVDSQPGEGTTFKVYFPRIEDEVENQVIKESPFPTGSENILIVDDDASIANLTHKRLQMLGYSVKAMTSSRDTLEHFRNDPNAYDLVITDQTMPEMTGEKLATELLSIRPDLPIIICTGYSSKIDADKASLIGIRAFIMKPVENEELSRTVRKVLDEQ